MLYTSGDYNIIIWQALLQGNLLSVVYKQVRHQVESKRLDGQGPDFCAFKWSRKFGDLGVRVIHRLYLL